MNPAALPMRIAVTVLFAAVGMYCLWQSTRPRAGRIGYGLHTLMCVSMAAMAWAPPPLASWQMAMFAAAGGWFAVQAVGVTPSSLRIPVAAGVYRPPAAHGTGERLRCAHHTALMAVMVWMFLLATTTTRAMAGMGVPPPSGLDRTVTGLAGVYSAVTAGLLTAAAVAAAARRGRAMRYAGPARDDLAHGLMAAGMAAMLLAMA